MFRIAAMVTPMSYLRIKRVHGALLFLIIAGTTFLRMMYINQPFIDFASWRETDDASIADNFYRGNINIFLPEISWNGPAPNYVGYEFQLTTYLAAFLYHLFGRADWVGRGLAVAFGLWGLFAFYNLVRRAFDENKALLCCAVLAVTPGGIYVDRSFLPDPVMVSLIITSFWMLLVYLQDHRVRYLLVAALTGTAGLLTKISGLIVGVPVLYVILTLLPTDPHLRVKYLIRLTMTGIAVLAPVIAYYGWALHVSHAYPPYHLAGSSNWVWDSSLESWLQAGYFWPKLFWDAEWMWGIPLLTSALLGLVVPPAWKRGNLPWLFHCWFMAGIIFYVFGARELVNNPWNFHIIDPALAGLAAQGLLVAGSWLARLRPPTIAGAAIILVVVAISGFEMKNLRRVYGAYARQTRELGLALGKLSQPSDLVLTIANDIGNPAAIYYSHRRGWVFPPAWPGVVWWADIMDEPAAIQLFDQLQSEGAQWLGIVGEQRIKLGKSTPKLLAHIEKAAKLVGENPDWVIYQIAPKPATP